MKAKQLFWPLSLTMTLPLLSLVVACNKSEAVVTKPIEVPVEKPVEELPATPQDEAQLAEEGEAGYINARQGDEYDLMSVAQYNATYRNFRAHEAAIAVIANGVITTEVTKIYEPTNLIDVLRKLTKIEFRYYEHSVYGLFVNSFRLKSGDEDAPWLHGRSEAKNYDDYYPFIFYNNSFAQVGVSTLEVNAFDIIEFTYDFE